MIVRNARGVEEDWGPYQRADYSNLKMVGASGMTGTSRWSNQMMTIVPREPRPKYEYQSVTLDELCAAEDCSNRITTKQPALAIYCSKRCRERIAKRRSDARKKAARCG